MTILTLMKMADHPPKGHEQFLLFLQCFQETYTADT